MAKNTASIPSTQLTPQFDEQEWVIYIRSSLDEEIDEEDSKTPVSIYCVPTALVSSKPEAYEPQLFALGPYHHWRPQLYDMERYKLAAARRHQARLQGIKLHHVVEQFMKHDYKIRLHYHKNFDLSKETLAWMMAIDASFLLEFLRNFVNHEGEEAQERAKPRSLSKWAANERMRMAYNMILRDTMMLENQIPLFLLRKQLNLQCSSKDLTNSALSKMLAGFIVEVSPFKKIENSAIFDGITRHAHLLELLYYIIVPKPKEPLDEIHEEIEEPRDGEPKELEEFGDTSNVKRLCHWALQCLSGVKGGPIAFVKRLIFSRPLKFIVKLPWKLISSLPILSLLKTPLESLFSSVLTDKSKGEEETNNTNKPPLAEEIKIPSVTDLVDAGVKFSPTKGDITTIDFDVNAFTLYLPVVSLDINTEVILRNLVAYEASVVSGPLVFTRYTELMNGIVDTEEDVKLLRERGIVVNRMKSDAEATELWNGMSKSVRLTRVEFLDRVIGDVNRFYGSRWRVKCKEFMRRYVFGSWQVLTLLAAALLLLMSCVQAFCSVYSCSSHLTKITSVGD